MINLDLAIARARVIARDNGYGYSQARRNTGKEGDCSSYTLDCLKAAGFNIVGATYTGNMLKPLLAAGFVDVTKSVNLKTGEGLQEADVCLRPATGARGGHVVLILKADGREILQSAGDFDSKPGDSSGREICIRAFYNSPFVYALRYQHATTVVLPIASAPLVSCPYTEPTTIYTRVSKFSDNDAQWFQWQLNRIGYKLTVDGIAGTKTKASIWYEIGQGHKTGKITSDVAGKQIRDYLKSVPSK